MGKDSRGVAKIAKLENISDYFLSRRFCVYRCDIHDFFLASLCGFAWKSVRPVVDKLDFGLARDSASGAV